MIYPKNHPVLRKRHEIFMNYVKKKSIPLKKTDVLALDNPEEYFLRQNGEAKLIDWIRPMVGKKYGVFAGGDRYAIHLTNSAYRNGLSIPRDFSLVGVDNVAPSAYLVSPLTTVDIPVQRDGRRSFELLLKLIRGETKKISEKSEVSLVVRKSG